MAAPEFIFEANGWRHKKILPHAVNRIVALGENGYTILGIDVDVDVGVDVESMCDKDTLYYWGKFNFDGTVDITDPTAKFMRADGTTYTLVDGELIKVVCDLLNEISIPPPGKFERQVTGEFSCKVYEDGTLSCNNPQAKVGQLRVCGVFCGTPGQYVKDPKYTDGWTRYYLGEYMSGEIRMLGNGGMYSLHGGVIGPWKI